MTMKTATRWFLALGALNLALSVALGAAGMHGLKPLLEQNDPAGWFRTALHYHQLHALGLLVVGLTIERTHTHRWLLAAGVMLLIGILLFSGNLYLRSIAGIHVLHAVTPFGGASFILGWLLLAVGAWRSKDLPR